MKKTLFLKNAILLFLALAALQLSGCESTAGAATKDDGGLDPQIASQLQAILDAAAADEASRYPGVILRLETAAGTWNGTSGVPSVETNSPIEPAAKFRCGSIIKPFISTVILQLVEEGKLSLDDRLPDLLESEITELFEYSDTITLKMLLNHTSGIGEWTGVGYEFIYNNYPTEKIWSEKELFAMAVEAGTNFPPGEKWLYNNTEYNLLGLIIEAATGTSWRNNIRERIFSKIALKNTLLPEPGNKKMPGSHVNGYEYFSGVFTDTTELDPSMAGAAGGHALVSNTEDLAIFIQALLNGAFFNKPGTLPAMLTFVDTGAPGRSYGLGIGRYALPDGSYAFGHTGGTAGYSSFVFHFPGEGISASSVMTTDQGDAMVKYLFPSLDLLATHLQNHE